MTPDRYPNTPPLSRTLVTRPPVYEARRVPFPSEFRLEAEWRLYMLELANWSNGVVKGVLRQEIHIFYGIDYGDNKLMARQGQWIVKSGPYSFFIKDEDHLEREFIDVP